MVQIIDRSPSFGSQLAQVLGQAGVNVAEGFAQRRSNQADERILQEFGNNPNLTPLQQIQAFAKLSPNKQQALSPLFGQYMKTQGVQQVANQKAQQEQSEKLKQQEQEQAEWKAVFDRLDKNLEYTGLKAFTPAASLPFTKTAQHREEFDVDAFQLERFARIAHTKGAMSTKIYESLLNKIPQAGLTKAQNRGRIKAWKDNILKNPELAKIYNETIDEARNTPNQSNQAKPGFTFIIDPSDGELVEIPNDKVKAAQAKGYKLK